MLYVNGVLAKSRVASVVVPSTTGDQLRFNSPDGVEPFYGVLDEVAIYSHALSGQSVQAHYLAGTAP